MTMVMSAICVEKGGISMENYVGRFFAADMLEYITEYGYRLMQDKLNPINPEIKDVIERFAQNYERVKALVTPTQRPIHEMTLEEFERLMNI